MPACLPACQPACLPACLSLHGIFPSTRPPSRLSILRIHPSVHPTQVLAQEGLLPAPAHELSESDTESEGDDEGKEEGGEGGAGGAGGGEEAEAAQEEEGAENGQHRQPEEEEEEEAGDDDEEAGDDEEEAGDEEWLLSGHELVRQRVCNPLCPPCTPLCPACSPLCPTCKHMQPACNPMQPRSAGRASRYHLPTVCPPAPYDLPTISLRSPYDLPTISQVARVFPAGRRHERVVLGTIRKWLREDAEAGDEALFHCAQQRLQPQGGAGCNPTAVKAAALGGAGYSPRRCRLQP